MFCFKCGASMLETSPVCPQCGAEIKNAPRPAAVAQPQAPWTGSRAGLQLPYVVEPPTDGKATASMVLGISGILCFWGILGIPAVILGHLAKSSISKSMGRLKGDGMATAGLVMGYISVVLGALVLVSIVIQSVNGPRSSVNESMATATVRTLNSSETRYSTGLGSNGSYARDLATLGPGPSGTCAGSGTAEHACLIDGILGNDRCKSGIWCRKFRYQYSIIGICPEGGSCTDYVIVATPVSPLAGRRSFCSTSDSIVRFRPGPILTPLHTVAECQAWLPARESR